MSRVDDRLKVRRVHREDVAGRGDIAILINGHNIDGIARAIGKHILVHGLAYGKDVVFGHAANINLIQDFRLWRVYRSRGIPGYNGFAAAIAAPGQVGWSGGRSGVGRGGRRDFNGSARGLQCPALAMRHDSNGISRFRQQIEECPLRGTIWFGVLVDQGVRAIDDYGISANLIGGRRFRPRYGDGVRRRADLRDHRRVRLDRRWRWRARAASP